MPPARATRPQGLSPILLAVACVALLCSGSTADTDAQPPADQPTQDTAPQTEPAANEDAKPKADTGGDAKSKAESSDTDLTKRTADPLDDVPSFGGALVRMAVVLVSIIIVLLILARYLPKWLGKTLTVSRGGVVQVVDSLQLEPRRRVYLLRVGEQFILVGTGEQGMTTLADQSLDREKLLELFNEQRTTGGGGGGGKGKPSLSFSSVLGSKDDPKRYAQNGE